MALPGGSAWIAGPAVLLVRLAGSRPPGAGILTTTMSHGCGSSGVSTRGAGRVVPVMHLIAFWRREAGPLTTTMEHRGGPG